MAGSGARRLELRRRGSDVGWKRDRNVKLHAERTAAEDRGSGPGRCWRESEQGERKNFDCDLKNRAASWSWLKDHRSRSRGEDEGSTSSSN